MNRFKHAIFLLIISICSSAFAVDPASRSIRPASDGSQIACPSRDFPEFIKEFSESTEVQMAFTKYPLQQQRLDANAEPEPKPVRRKLRRDQVSFPVLPNEAERKKQSLVLTIEEKKPNHVKLTLVKDDTDYQINYFFSLNSCWRLERIEDWSLCTSANVGASPTFQQLAKNLGSGAAGRVATATAPGSADTAIVTFNLS